MFLPHSKPRGLESYFQGNHNLLRRPVSGHAVYIFWCVCLHDVYDGDVGLVACLLVCVFMCSCGGLRVHTFNSSTIFNPLYW